MNSLRLPQLVSSLGLNAFARCTGMQNLEIWNASCAIADSAATISDTIRIFGVAGSTAEQYAKTYQRQFFQLQPVETTTTAAGSIPSETTTTTVAAITTTQDATTTMQATTATALDTTTVMTVTTTQDASITTQTTTLTTSKHTTETTRKMTTVPETTTTAVHTTQTGAHTERIPGDLNQDRQVTLADVTIALTIYAESCVSALEQFPAWQVQAADIDGDGVLTIQDSTLLLTYLSETAVGNTNVSLDLWLKAL